MALCDSFNTALALVIIADLITKTNAYIKANQRSAIKHNAYLSICAVKEVARWITRMLEIFELSASAAVDALEWTTEPSSTDSLIPESESREATILPYVRLISQFRDQAKYLAISDSSSSISRELLNLTDTLRDTHLLPLGILLEDRNCASGEPALIKKAGKGTRSSGEEREVGDREGEGGRAEREETERGG